jgi:hypothetical protein
MKNKTNISNFNDPKFNTRFSGIVLILSWIIGISSYVHPSANHGAIVPYIFPPFFFICTVSIYFLSRIFLKKFNWVITVIGAVVNLFYAIQWYAINNI